MTDTSTHRAVYVGRAGSGRDKLAYGWLPADAAPDASPSWFSKGPHRVVGAVYDVRAVREGDTFTSLILNSPTWTGDRHPDEGTVLGWEARDRDAYRADERRKDEARARREGVAAREGKRLADTLLTGCRSRHEAEARLRAVTDAAMDEYWRQQH
jgi:hypothetical protein